MTAQELINLSLQDIGVIASGESPATEESADGLVVLNALIASWSAQIGPIPEITRVEVTLDGSDSYTLATRALLIKSAGVSNDGVQIPYRVVQAEAWAAGDDNRVLWYDGGYPTGEVYVRPAPTAGTLELYNYEPLSTVATLITAIALPPGYERALIKGLGVDLAQSYGRELTPGMVSLANDAKLGIQGLNQTVLGAAAATG